MSIHTAPQNSHDRSTAERREPAKADLIHLVRSIGRQAAREAWLHLEVPCAGKPATDDGRGVPTGVEAERSSGGDQTRSSAP